jgi:hypothetical protein
MAQALLTRAGDRAQLLPIGEYQGIRIIGPRAFLEMLG